MSEVEFDVQKILNKAEENGKVIFYLMFFILLNCEVINHDCAFSDNVPHQVVGLFLSWKFVGTRRKSELSWYLTGFWAQKRQTGIKYVLHSYFFQFLISTDKRKKRWATLVTIYRPIFNHYLVLFSGVKRDENGLMYLVELNSQKATDLVLSDRIKQLWPKQLIAFLEERLFWQRRVQFTPDRGHDEHLAEIGDPTGVPLNISCK